MTMLCNHGVGPCNSCYHDFWMKEKGISPWGQPGAAFLEDTKAADWLWKAGSEY